MGQIRGTASDRSVFPVLFGIIGHKSDSNRFLQSGCRRARIQSAQNHSLAQGGHQSESSQYVANLLVLCFNLVPMSAVCFFQTLTVEVDHIAEGEEAVISYMEENGFITHARVHFPFSRDTIFMKDTINNLSSL